MTPCDLSELLALLQTRREQNIARGFDPDNPGQVAFLADGRSCCPKCLSYSADCAGHGASRDPEDDRKLAESGAESKTAIARFAAVRRAENRQRDAERYAREAKARAAKKAARLAETTQATTPPQ
ncbi:hypothetical protein [Variovorax sp. PBL-E5]|uniref:hypothetical protein n=1 Tax=Variovorax sp. PBL-E5 TaxID=434014 RepID=UPI001315C8C5|nr:hypothetical protein [Variovorax sp. PBL-E5]VTU29966.1 hypothetical protein E5CHR_02918 [Variovorax sp. PBL-E5]